MLFVIWRMIYKPPLRSSLITRANKLLKLSKLQNTWHVEWEEKRSALIFISTHVQTGTKLDVLNDSIVHPEAESVISFSISNIFFSFLIESVCFVLSLLSIHFSMACFQTVTFTQPRAGPTPFSFLLHSISHLMKTFQLFFRCPYFALTKQKKNSKYSRDNL